MTKVINIDFIQGLKDLGEMAVNETISKEYAAKPGAKMFSIIVFTWCYMYENSGKTARSQIELPCLSIYFVCAKFRKCNIFYQSMKHFDKENVEKSVDFWLLFQIL